MDICRVPNCLKPQQALGVCTEHLSVITKQVQAGQATWKQYEEAGICLPSPKLKNHNKCLTEKCHTKPRSRGLCDNCYAAAVRMMKKKNLQWPDLEQLGLSRPMRRRDFIKQSFFQEAAKLAIEEKAAKDRISYSLPVASAPPEQPISLTQAEPLPLTLPPDVTLQGVPIGYDNPLSQQEAAPPVIVPNLTTRPSQPLVPLSVMPPPAVSMPTAVQTPIEPPEVSAQAPMAEEKFPGFKDSTGTVPPTVEQMREAVKDHDFQPLLDLSRINAPEPEPQEPALEVQSFPAPPTQIPGQEN